jgi:formate dehydrogenase subunit beta
LDVKAEYLIKIEDFSQLLKTMLKEKFVNKIIGAQIKVDKKTNEVDRFTLSPVLIENVDGVGEFPLTNFIAYGYARTDSTAKYLHKSAQGALKDKVGIIARPCDTRAIIELVKLKQIKLDNLFIIAIEDRGVVLEVGKELKKVKGIDLAKIIKEKVEDNGLILQFSDGKVKEVPNLPSENCLRCIRKSPVIADLSISDIGVPIESDQIILKVHSEKGINLLEKSKIGKKSLPKDIKQANAEKMADILKKAEEKRKQDLEEWAKLSQEEKIERLQKCTMCGMCIRGCPVCYCVDCILAQKRKDKNINKESYQLTRIAHVADRCVECGNCDNNCPMSLPLSLYFQSLNETFKKKFNYGAGESIEDIPFRSGKAIREMELEKT